MRDQTHILIVDDHREIRDLVGQLLLKEGYRVSSAADGREMRDVLRTEDIDLVVLDLMLPAEDGLTLCRELRASGSVVPIIILTAKGDEIDRVLGLEMGADDYVPKPFSGRELVARINAVLRRTRQAPPPAETGTPDLYRFGKWTLHAARREIEADDLIVPLSAGEFDLLMAFIQNPRRVLSRDRLLDLAKGRWQAPLDRSVDLQVSRLRRKLEDDPRNPTIIKTVWGDGYLFTPKVSVECD